MCYAIKFIIYTWIDDIYEEGVVDTTLDLNEWGYRESKTYTVCSYKYNNRTKLSRGCR